LKRYFVMILLWAVCSPVFAKTHNDMFDVSCTTLWPAVKDALRNSGYYGIIGIDNTEMTASYNIGGALGGKRINSLVLNPKGEKCEMQVQTAYSGLIHNDEGDLKKRVNESLVKLQVANSGASAKTQTPGTVPPKSESLANPVTPNAPPQKR